MSSTFAVSNGSVIMKANGQPQTLEGYDKIQQDINDILLTPFDPNRNYGNELLGNGVIVSERAAIPGLVQRDISAAIGRLRSYQTQLASDQLPDDEKINKLETITTAAVGSLGIGFLATISVVDVTQEMMQKVFNISNEHLQR